MEKIDYDVWADKYKPRYNEHDDLVDADPRVGKVTQEEFKKAKKKLIES